ncbi:MAG: hypothetical protein RLZZ432_507 [Chloroflexota bacterium]|jgi:carboxyl-terminal processing protease
MSRTPSPPERTPLITRLGAILLAIAIAAFSYQAGLRAGAGDGTGASGSVDLSRFNEVLDLVVQRHVGDETEQQLVDGAIKGLVESLNDPYSVYLTADEMQSMIDGLSGSFEGIGATIETLTVAGEPCKEISADCQLSVVAPIDGSPAEAAGLQSGDRIIAVDGANMYGETTDAAILRVRGKKGTTVVLSVVRGGAASIDISIVRDTIIVPAVEPKTLTAPGGAQVGYLRLAEFSDVAGDQFHSALQKVVDAGTTRVIIDLRDNPGGYLSAALKIASEFIADGTVYIEEERGGARTTTTATPGGIATDPKIRLVVLVNNGSASASEILAGALQDRGRAQLVGETTYGKGVVQTFIDITGGYGLKLTIAKWLTPNGRWIHKTGLVPDVPVAADEAGATPDPVLAKALELLK